MKASGRYRFLTPDQLIAEVRDADQYGPLVMHPLVGGMPVDEAWKSVQLLIERSCPRSPDVRQGTSVEYSHMSHNGRSDSSE